MNINDNSSKNLGLYIHIPFCAAKCAYCDFYSMTGYTDYQRYIDSILLHMEDYSVSAKSYTIDTIFVGGGTPTVLPRSVMLNLIDGIHDNFKLSDDAEFTIEANPATVDVSMLKKYKKSGVNRLSMGLQSANDNELAALSRIHTYSDFEKSYKDARDAKFDNINIDLMYGIPEQNEESLQYTLEKVCDLEPEHISLYGLKIEPETPFGKCQDSLILPDEDMEYEMYFNSIQYLAMKGYKQYEISNFARDGYQCRHNLKYWNCNEYLGFGPAAHSYYNGTRFSFKHDINTYIDAMEIKSSNVNIIDECYNISLNERMGEYVMLRLRLNEGVNTDEFYELFGIEFESIYSKYLKLYIRNEYMKQTNNNYSFTTKGMFVSNYILSAMLDFDSDISSNIVNGTDK